MAPQHEFLQKVLISRCASLLHKTPKRNNLFEVDFSSELDQASNVPHQFSLTCAAFERGVLNMRCFKKMAWLLAVFFISSVRPGLAAIPLRHILYSTNDLADMGLSPVEGEILYDMVSGGISVHLGGVDYILPQVRSGELQESETGFSNSSSAAIGGLRTVLLPTDQVANAQEGEIALDKVLGQIRIFRSRKWRPLGQKVIPISLPGGVRDASFAQFRTVLPNVTDVVQQEGEIVADFVNKTVLLKVNGKIVDLRLPPKNLEGADNE